MIYSTNNAIKEKKCVEIGIKNLLVLCDIIEDYESFTNDLDSVMKTRMGIDLSIDAHNAMMGKKSLGSKRFKKFIEKHKESIEIIKKYSCLSDFTIFCYNNHGKRRNNFSEEFFYKYIQDHKKDIETIKSVLLKLDDLGFKKIIFGEHLDFTGVEYKLNTAYRCDFEYLENIEINPSYLNNYIYYKTNNSCYCMYLKARSYGDNQSIDKYESEIELNTLVFNPDRLPECLDSTIKEIKQLALLRKDEYQAISDTVDLSVYTDDLNSQFENFKKLAEKSETIKDSKKLKEILKEMQNQLNQLKLFGQDVESKVIESHESITNETIANEKKLYLNRRYWGSIDID